MMKQAYLPALTALCIIMSGSPIKAQTIPFEPGNEPLEITADGSLEWKRSEQLFIARKNALAVQGDASVAAETLTAYYKEGSEENADSDLQIHKIIAEENVKLVNAESTAYGDKATYDLDEGLAILTGGDLKLISPDQTITAQERFEYWVEEGRAKAIGRPRVVRPKVGGGQDTVDADELDAIFKENAQGERVIDTLEARGNVIITTPTEVARGAYGIYRGGTNKAELSGGVTITRGPNILEGNRAIVDLNTNTSQIFGGNQNNGRVRGVFYPNSEKKAEEQPKPTPVVNAPVTQVLDVIEPAAAPETLAPAVEVSAPPPAMADIEPEAGDPEPTGTQNRGWAPLTGHR